MSKNRNINSSSDFGQSPPDVESLLRLAAPADVSLDRDALMFQAGLRAASTGRASRFLWPAIAAALLLVCGGVSVALVRETHHSNTLERSLAELESKQSSNGAIVMQPNSNPAATRLVAAESRDEANFAATQSPRLRNLRFLTATTRMPSGQLTAAGWERRSDEAAPAQPVRSASPGETIVPRRPATYLELLRSYQEG